MSEKPEVIAVKDISCNTMETIYPTKAVHALVMVFKDASTKVTCTRLNENGTCCTDYGGSKNRHQCAHLK